MAAIAGKSLLMLGNSFSKLFLSAFNSFIQKIFYSTPVRFIMVSVIGIGILNKL